MPTTDDKLLKRLLLTFKVEAQEHIQTIASDLLELERTEGEEARAAVLDTTFRAAHSLKGAARTVNVKGIETLCQSLENVFATLKRKELALSAELFDLLHRVVDALGRSLHVIDVGAAATEGPGVTDLIRSLQIFVAEKRRTKPPDSAEQSTEIPTTSVSHVAQTAVEKHGSTDTIRVATSKLDAVLLQTEELLSAKLAVTQHAIRLRQCRAEPAEWRKKWIKLRPDVRVLRQALDAKQNGSDILPVSSHWRQVVEFLDWNQHFVESLDAELMSLAKAADHDQRSVGAMVDNLLDDVKKVVMQPFATVLGALPRFVRELSRDQGKTVELVIGGEEIEIDRRILEEMKDPLIHLVRNCLDHGIETPRVRAERGKPPQGTLSIGIAAHDASKVELVITDDGSGIDAAIVTAAMVKSRLLSPQQAGALSDREALSLIFQSGVSTSPIITDISGRGLGLAIVKEKVEKLNGSVSAQTTPGTGTSFRIILPLTLARFRGTFVLTDEQLFVLPTSNVERVMRVRKDIVKTVENRDTIMLNGRAIALSRLDAALGLARKTAGSDRDVQLVVVLTSGSQRIAFVVDDILNEQEILVKPLGKQLARVRNITGATVLANGKVVPILNVADLMKSAVRASETSIGVSPAAAAPAVDKQSVLVAEDSITSRILLKNILEAAGYQVETAVDGIDAFTKLRSGTFDLVVSDVEMPRLNGFGLTSRVRADKKFSELPVVLVTALESREDRERGIDAGANAYIVKSSFDQGNLLEVIKRLI